MRLISKILLGVVVAHATVALYLSFVHEPILGVITLAVGCCWLLVEARLRDACEVCHGARGGVPGNENVVDGIVMCDDCYVERWGA